MKSKNNLPAVVFAGRKNVGKSSIFNRLVGFRRSLVADYKGLTRDPVVFDAQLNGRNVRLVDLPGYFLEPRNDIEKAMNDSFKRWLQNASVIVFVVDARSSVTKEDDEIAELVRKSGKPFLLVANKTEHKPSYYEHLSDIYSLSMGEPLEIAAEHNLGFDELINEILKKLPKSQSDEEMPVPNIKVSIIGRPNVGKSSLLNSILGEELSMVTDIPGTTRDTMDVVIEHNETQILFIDTAGLRRKNKVKKGSVESFSGARTLRALMNSDVCILVLDASEGVLSQDKKIASTIQEESKGVVVAINKWDVRKENILEEVERELFFLEYAPKVAVSAKHSWNVEGLLEKVVDVYNSYSAKVPTSVVAGAITEFSYTHSMPSKHGKRLKVYYATQLSSEPPTFAVFANFPKLFTDSLKRSMERFLRNRIPELENSPLRIVVKARR